MRRRAPAAALAALLLCAAAARAQQPVRLEGEGDAALDRRIARLLSRGNPLTITRDTLITDTVPGAVLVLGAALTLEGRVAGDLVAVDANVFLRPRSEVSGDVVNAGGGLYPSELARVGGRTLDLPTARYAVRHHASGTVIVAGTDRAHFRMEGGFGFHIPTYDRVNGLGLRWGATYALPEVGGVTPRMRGEIGYATERGALLGGSGLLLERGVTTLEIGWYRRLQSNERWIRSAITNSIAYAWSGREHWNHYQADVAFAELRRALRRGRTLWTPRLRVQVEDAVSLRADQPWSLWNGDDGRRANPLIDDGRIAALSAGLAAEWQGAYSAAELDAAIEIAGAALGGDFEFAAFTATGEWEMQAIGTHRLELEGHFRAPLPGSGQLPRQRWSYAGGFGALQTLPRGDRIGDHVVYVETAYIIPFPPRLRLPLLGAPDLMLLHGVGMGWTDATRRDLEQNVGLRLQFFAVYLRYLLNPLEPSDQDFDVSVSWPF